MGAPMTTGHDATCDVLAARLRLNHVEEIRVVAQSFNGRCYLHIREYVLGDDDEFTPTRKGVSIPISRLEEILDAVRELRSAPSEASVAATIPNGNSNEIRFSVSEWKGIRKADIRSFFKAHGEQEFRPGKGVRFNLALLPELERGLELLDRQISG
jgi:hypothetical protein